MTARLHKISPLTMRRRVLDAVRPVGTEPVRIESARGRVLAKTVRARHSSPQMNCSMMDGYALNHRSVRNASRDLPARLPVVAEIGAGQRMLRALAPNQAARIMTGAPLPDGADCVVRLEETQMQGRSVLIFAPTPRFKDVRLAGSEFKDGQSILAIGSAIGPAEMAMLAHLDRPRVQVYRRPRVGVISTGDELGTVGRKRPYGHIVDSNRYALLGLIESAGCDPIDGGRVGDDPETLWKQITNFCPLSDFIITSGGVSAGDRDVVKLLFARRGKVDLYRLPMKPGKPQAFGRVGRTPFFGLPGNPVSAMVVFDLIIRPALRKLAGATAVNPLQWTATVARDFPRKSRDWEFPRAIAVERDGHWEVTPAKSQQSSNIRSMTDSNGYLVLPPTSPGATKGVEVLFMPRSM